MVVELGELEVIEDWLEEYSYEKVEVERIKVYLTRNSCYANIFFLGNRTN